MEGPVDARNLSDLACVNLIGNSPEFRLVVDKALHIAKFDVPVSIFGETGSGKEVLAEAVHYSSPRAHGPFIPVNCGALAESLLESELFGHEKGSFTNAIQSHQGLIEQAEKGTLFLDEIEALSHKGQTALLRFLQDYHYRRVGGKQLRQADVRVITATNIPLTTLRSQGILREDLFYRLNVMPLNIPPLRERGGDVVLLAEHFLNTHRARLGLRGKRFSTAAVDWLGQQSWPGNVRELENLVLRGVLSAVGDTIEPAHFHYESTISGNTAKLAESSLAIAFHTMGRTDLPFGEAKQQAMNHFEQSYLKGILQRAGGNVSKAARWAGKERRAFGKLLKKHDIDPRHFY